MKKPNRSAFHKGTCPACKEPFQLEPHAVALHSFADCPHCMELLEIVSINPLKLSVAEVEGEDEP